MESLGNEVLLFCNIRGLFAIHNFKVIILVVFFSQHIQLLDWDVK